VPNYKIFQDSADSLRTKIYGVTSGGAVQPLLTTADGKMQVQGAITIDSGDVVTVVNKSGNPLWVRNDSGGSIWVKNDSGDALYVVNNSGDPFWVKNDSGDALYVKNTSGSQVFVKNDSGDSLYVTLHDRTIVDSGAVTLSLGSGSVTKTSGVHYVLDYNAYTYAVKNNFASGTQTVRLESCAISGAAADADWLQDNSGTTIGHGEWKFLTADFLVKYARLKATSSGSLNSGTFSIYFQAQK